MELTEQTTSLGHSSLSASSSSSPATFVPGFNGSSRIGGPTFEFLPSSGVNSPASTTGAPPTTPNKTLRVVNNAAPLSPGSLPPQQQQGGAASYMEPSLTYLRDMTPVSASIINLTDNTPLQPSYIGDLPSSVLNSAAATDRGAPMPGNFSAASLGAVIPRPPQLFPPSSSSSSMQSSTRGLALAQMVLGSADEDLGLTTNGANKDVGPVQLDGGESPESGAEAASTSNAATAAVVGSAVNIISPTGQRYVDITEFLTLPQSEAAKRLGIPTSTLSKRWKEAVRGRKWPYRSVAKCDKEIMTLLHNIPQGSSAQQLPEEVEASLSVLMRKRQEELKPVVIRLS